MFAIIEGAQAATMNPATSSRQRLSTIATGLGHPFDSSSRFLNPGISSSSSTPALSSELVATCTLAAILLLTTVVWRFAGPSLFSRSSNSKKRKHVLPTPPVVRIPREIQLSEAGHEAYNRALDEHGDVVIIPRHGRMEYVVDHHHVRDVLTDANSYSFEKAVTNMLHMEFMLWFKNGTFVQELDKLVQDGVTPRLRAVVEKIAPVFSQEAHDVFAKQGGGGSVDQVEIPDMYEWIHHSIARAMVILIIGEQYLDEDMTKRFMDVVVAVANLSGIYENTRGWRYLPWLWSLKTTLGAIFFTVVPRFFFGILPRMYANKDAHLCHGVDVENNEYAPFFDLLAAKHRDRKTNKFSFLNFVWCAVVCLGIIFASIHQTAVVAAWCVMNLAKRSEYQDEIRAEIESCMEQDADGNRQLTVESLRRAEKLDSFIRETMRTKGDVFAPVRFTVRDVRVGKYIIPKGALVAPYVKRAHEHADNYGSQGTVFDGRRWVGDRPAVQGSHDFISFGLGRWACPGRHLAVAELKMVVATLFDAYDVSLKDDTFKAADPMNATSVAPTGIVQLRRRR